MSHQFTPGPWNCFYRDSRCFDYRVVSPPDVRPFEFRQGQHRANAALISAAPDLFEAVCHALEVNQNKGKMEDVDWNMLYQALRKAEGEI